ncbi:DNA polymerase III subunit delta [Novosphingobium sp. FSY-8]|uniref:DNA-directed DNA polymerase n=1 Tax=Novosphingobium ovatum TaxID=1908523 RepID=A0ABW9XGI6_9SPHN|nr:DNA polymerase III subunit delta [Novosphingobium ovatum]NBC37659.1 DNA polymerase III subunit delta [Novosphingobium ovatum]
MKATQKDFASVAPRAAKQARVFFLCGPDDAGVQDAAHRIAGLIDNPGERVDMTGAELRKDPVRLDDEARSVSLFGDTRHIWIRCSGDEAHDAIANLIAGDVAPCPVIVQAVNATDKSRTAKLLEKRDDALVAMFYPPDLRAVTGSVRRMADAAGLRMNEQLAEQIAIAVGQDTRLAQSELTKLALYLDALPERPRNADADAYAAIGAGTQDDGFAPVVNAILSGDRLKIGAEMRRMREMDMNAVGLLLAFERRAAQLAQLAAKLGPRGSVAGLIESETSARRIFWRDAPELTRQLQVWRGRSVERLAARLMQLHRRMMADSQSSTLQMAQELVEIARVAAASH